MYVHVLYMQFKPDVEVTELALAFPISPDLTTITLAKVGDCLCYIVNLHAKLKSFNTLTCTCFFFSSLQDLQQQQVFAFLPLRSYGFRFILQGDFDLPSSREDVNSDSPWNQWLREEIPPLFMKALDKMKVQMYVSKHW